MYSCLFRRKIKACSTPSLCSLSSGLFFHPYLVFKFASEISVIIARLSFQIGIIGPHSRSICFLLHSLLTFSVAPECLNIVLSEPSFFLLYLPLERYPVRLDNLLKILHDLHAYALANHFFIPYQHMSDLRIGHREKMK